MNTNMNMNTNANADVISKVQKLMATAADAAATPSEAATAMKLAQRLMDTHRITEAAIRAHARQQAVAAGDVNADDMDVAPLGPATERFDGVLAMAVGRTCGIGVYYARGLVPVRGGYRPGKTLRGYGLPADLAVAVELLAAVRAEAVAARNAWAKAAGVRSASVSGRSFADGYALALFQKADAEARARQTSTETISVEFTAPTAEAPMDFAGGNQTALVVVRVGEAAQNLERALLAKAAKLNLGTARSRSVSRDYSAFNAGRAAGSRVSLNRNGVR